MNLANRIIIASGLMVLSSVVIASEPLLQCQQTYQYCNRIDNPSHLECDREIKDEAILKIDGDTVKRKTNDGWESFAEGCKLGELQLECSNELNSGSNQMQNGKIDWMNAKINFKLDRVSGKGNFKSYTRYESNIKNGVLVVKNYEVTMNLLCKPYSGQKIF
ncbi:MULTISPECIES: hypothetical protein [unclassified Herbaspirillum]|uniref:hypothetical protein n=1 Tax=unclassified Herbaspirillum TaxID=2624150 RepID=UPI00114D8CFA|nr:MULTISPECIES: hypothetical protein [unclassified Herbaspirillum]MBB5391068.1 hypothetical protein [Herbaspirillum sp. SJZ102]